ncbi:MAG TPA: 2-dehydro-3-deoxygalactonokinase [Terracidiphilus sp.]|nr:2-dehydro-3-deoxygalactonokinase [Terracidiphilus sp.]
MNLEERTDKSSGKIALIGLDWGTSSLRTYLMECGGEVLAERKLPLGIMHLDFSGTEKDKRLAFDSALKEACGDWLISSPTIPVVACGMVGSAQGWHEVPYLDTPVRLDQLSRHLTPILTEDGRVVFVVPGLKQTTEPVNVMRGEETQLAGCMAGMLPMDKDSTVLIGLPGTHSKWVTLKTECVQHCETFMTGEVFEALCKHTILGRTMQSGGEEEPAAFDFGVQTAVRHSARGGVLSTIFTSRSLGLMGVLSAREQPAYLSGLLIGEEIAAVLRTHGEQLNSTSIRPELLLLVGDQRLCLQYQRAIQLVSGEEATVVADASSRGLWRIAAQANLISPVLTQKGAKC